MHSERFVQDMVKALQNNAIENSNATTAVLMRY
jgi:hypothetical protein